MWGIVWLDSAVNDIARLREFIAKENPSAARRAAEVIKNSVQRLVDLPLIGKPLQELPQYRELFIQFGAGGYILRYRVKSELIFIVHVRHYRESIAAPIERPAEVET